ncbi:TPT-domain-containing protein [Imleria badia]|nr:TPT-domain-containing protein [Imleria badia]
MSQDEKNRHPQDAIPAEKHELAQLRVEEHDQESVSLDAQSSLDSDSDLSSPSLPTPATTPSKPQRTKIPAAAIIPVWILLSSTVILYNNHVYNTYGFRYPVFLVTWHLTFAAIGTRVLQRTTNLLDGVKDVPVSRTMFLRSILPIGLLFSGSLILSNSAYLYLSIAYIQMLKAFTPVAILLISWLSRTKEPNRILALIVCMISSGVALASHGELHFDLTGFLIQAGAVAFEASRLVMIEILLHGLKMDPLVSLHYYAPVCAVINLLVLPFTEGLEPFYEIAAGNISWAVLISNALVAFLLNVAAVFLVSAGSGLVLTLAGVFKDILLIAGSVLLFGTPITPLQIFGYSVALCGLVLYKTCAGK